MNIVSHGVQSIDVEFRFRTLVSGPNVKANIRLPKTFRVLSGDQSWTGATTKDQWYSLRLAALPAPGISEVAAGVSMYQGGRPVGAKSAVLFVNVSDSGVTVTRTDPSPKPAPPQPKYRTRAQMFSSGSS